MKKSTKIMIVIMVLGLIVTFGIVSFSKIKIKEYESVNFNVKYDTTWKVEKIHKELRLKHKKTKAILSIQGKVIENNYIDTKLSDLIDDIIYGIEEQNKDYQLINMMESPSSKYDSYSYLYEKDMEQVLVNIYKKDNKVIIVYYQADSEYYDIVLDSVDSILNSLEIVSGEEVK